MKSKIDTQKPFFLLIVLILCFLPAQAYDVTLVGVLRFNGGMTRLPIGLIDILKNDLSINFISTEPWRTIDFTDVKDEIKQIAAYPDKSPGNVAFLLEHPWFVWSKPADYVPESRIKIALSMIESTKIPVQWVDILNNQFDAVVVPDPYLLEVYRSCGVNIPIFFLPLGLMLDDYFAVSPTTTQHVPFTFGISGCLCPSKNQQLLIQAFAQEFGNSSDVKLKIHANNGFYEPHKQLIDSLGTSNIELIFESFSQPQLLDFMTSLDCYVLLSKGEGFSITPREALALGIPCILSNNTAQATLCKSGFVRPVESSLLEEADYRSIFGCHLGYKFNCTIDDARKALRDVYENYSYYKEKALQGREWVKRYTYKELKAKYLSLLKPKKVLLTAGENSVEDDCLKTNSKPLFDKFMSIIES